ncbi:E3 ubiquitin-protein ligase TRIM39-like [Mauremys mutica]|uniref:E3 ubiquitin-protein ligase TRIM39-like n=1 Tax=Mauremys mutica TaxID=74926 RepID=UPI001D1613DA|nr:E3 ubiquitin-protein ligase TRIM39-like [Mauremys mutica]
MASAHPLMKLLEEAVCPICLGYFKDPVSIVCGHNFCRVCITEHYEKWEMETEGVFCPQCKKSIKKENFQTNRQFASMVENIQELGIKLEDRKKQTVCRQHKNKHKLFCEDDGEVICLVCDKTQKHGSHTLVPIEKAAQEYKVKLHKDIELLKKAKEEISELKSKEQNKPKEWKDVKDTLARSEQVRLQEPELSAAELKNAYGVPGMMEVLREFTVDVTLDQDTANPKLILSEDRKHVRRGNIHQDLPNNPERFDPYPCVLGAEGFTGGRRYWEVEVGDKTQWELGVCRESVSRKGQVTFTPEDGFWSVWLRDGRYQALTSPWTSLPMSVRPGRVGIFLDYEVGEVSFYNVTDRSHLFTFTDTFSGKLRPYFYPGPNAGGKNATPLIICPVPAQARGNLCP